MMKVVIIFLLITALLMLIYSTIDYKRRMINLYKDDIKPKIYNISMVCVIMWSILICFIILFRFMK